MGKMRRLVLTDEQRTALVDLRDHAPRAYLRERAAALLKIAGGTPAAVVARQGLLRPREPATVAEWLNRFEAHGLRGLTIRPGRGRKPAFFPSVPHARGRQRRPAPRRAP